MFSCSYSLQTCRGDSRLSVEIRKSRKFSRESLCSSSTTLDYLASTYEKAMRCCYFPSVWKTGTTILIPKPGKCPSSATNYRPITLLAALGKVFERVIKSKLSAYVESYDILPETQAGFRTKRSTQDQLFKLAQDAAAAVKNDKVTIASLFDVEKSYDKIWREGLTLKLCTAGIPMSMTALIVDFLSDRTIKLKMGNHTSLRHPAALWPSAGIHNRPITT